MKSRRYHAAVLFPLLGIASVACVGPSQPLPSLAGSPRPTIAPLSSVRPSSSPAAAPIASTTLAPSARPVPTPLPTSSLGPPASPASTWSADGLNWTELTDLAVPETRSDHAQPVAASQGAGGYVAVGSALDQDVAAEFRWNGSVWLSEDGLSWRIHEKGESFDAVLFASTSALGGVLVGGPVSICPIHCDSSATTEAGSAVWITSDRLDWRPSVSGLEEGAVFVLAGNERLAVAAGLAAAERPADEAPAPGSSTTVGAIWASTDGSVWTRATGVPPTDAVRQVVESRGNLVALAGPAESYVYRSLLWSADGLRWTEAFGAWGITAIGASPDGFLVAGTDPDDSSPFVLLSREGREWELIPLVTHATLDLSRIIWIGDRYLALGTGRRTGETQALPIALTSVDGREWVEVVLPPAIAQSRLSEFASSLADGAILFGGYADEGWQPWLVQPERP